ncbi:MAG: ABC transporter ATP-binding protein [archaeon]
MKNNKEYALLLESVYKDYGPKRVLENLNLAVQPCEFVTVVGPSGCGKSTLLRLILGQEPPTYGTIFVHGQEFYRPSEEAGIVYQKYPLFPHLTVLENIMLGGRLERTPWGGWFKRKEIRQQALEYLANVNLQEHAYKYPFELSGGMQQRVAIAQAIFTKPKTLLMDEPFGALDAGTRESMQVYLLKTWQECQMTVFFVTHDLEEAVYLGTRIIALSQYYHGDADGAEGIKNSKHGARIVADYKLPRVALSTSIKEKAEFGQLIQQIRREAFDPQYLQDIDVFNLKHPDSFTHPDAGECEIKGTCEIKNGGNQG